MNHSISITALSSLALLCGCSDASTSDGPGAAGSGAGSTSGSGGVTMSGGSGAGSSSGGSPTAGAGGNTVAGAAGAAGAAGGSSTGGVGGVSAGGAGGAAGSGGEVGVAGAAGAGGADGGSGGSAGAPPSDGACDLSAFKWTGSASRPQLTDSIAPCYTVRRYLGDWDPTVGLPAAATLKPTYTVASDGSGTHTSVQAAVSAATGSARVYILVKPGTYREPVCVAGTTPITLYGADTDAKRVTIAYDNYNSKPVDGAKTNPCAAVSGATFGTSNSTTFFVKSNDFQAMNLTLANDYQEPGNGTAQAVAMTTQGDKLVFQNVRFIGNQDTLQPSSASESVVARAYYKSSFIEGDTDFIFGRGTAVFDACDISYIGTRKTGGSHLAPSTSGSNPYGFLIINSHIIGGAGTKPSGTTLGRAWNVSNATNPNGQVVIRDTIIDSHVNTAAPWADSTGGSSKPFDANTNRMFEYKNTGPGAM